MELGIFGIESTAVFDPCLIECRAVGVHHAAVGNSSTEDCSTGVEGTGVVDRGIERFGFDVEDTACNGFVFFSCRIICRCGFGSDGKAISNLIGSAVDSTESKFSTLTDDDISSLAVDDVVGQAVNGKFVGDNFITTLDHHIFGAVFSEREEGLFGIS